MSGNADLPIAAFLAEPTDGYQGVAMDTVTFDFLRPETTGPHAADKFIVISPAHAPALDPRVRPRRHRAARRLGPRARSTATPTSAATSSGSPSSVSTSRRAPSKAPRCTPADGVRLLPLRYPVAPSTQAVWDRAKQVCRDAVEAAGGTFVDLARELANPQTAHPLGGARMADRRRPTAWSTPTASSTASTASRCSTAPSCPSALGVNPSLTIAALVERAMARRVTALGRPDAAALRPSDVLEQRPARSAATAGPAAARRRRDAPRHRPRRPPAAGGRRPRAVSPGRRAHGARRSITR